MPGKGQEGMVTGWRDAGIIAFFASLLMLPAFLWGAGGGDLHCQALWVRHFSEQFWKGDIYPRWLMDMYAGNGSPVFFYYPPFAYFISALFYKILSQDYFAYPAIAASAWLATFCSGIAFWAWIRKEAGCNQALLGSLFYMCIPFHLGFTFYYTLLYSTVWAYAWLPLMFLFGREAAEGKAYGIPGFAVAVAGMALTHIPSLIIGEPCAVIFACCHMQRQGRNGALARVACASVLGMGLAAIFLLPAVSYMRYVAIDLQWSRLDYDANLLRLGYANMQQLQYSAVWLAQCAVALVFYKMTQKQGGRLRVYFIVLACAMLALTTAYARWLWDSVFFFKIIQHPARLFMVTSLCLSGLCAMLPDNRKILPMCLIVLFTAIIWGMAWHTRITPETFAQEHHLAHERYESGIDQYPSYLTHPGLMERYYKPGSAAKLRDDSGFVHVQSGDADVTVSSWQPRRISLAYHASMPSSVRVRQMYFPGWQGYVDGKAVETSWDEGTGQILLTLPPGENRVELRLTALAPEIEGKMVTMASACIIMLLLLVRARKAEA